MITFSPTNLELFEFIGTTGTTVTVSGETPGASSVVPALQITAVSIISNNAPPDLTLSFTNTTFTFSSIFSDMFNRTLKYYIQDVNYVNHYYEVNRFIDLPQSFTALYHYIPPAQDWMDINFSVTTNQGTSVWTLVLRHDFTASNAALVAAIPRETNELVGI